MGNALLVKLGSVAAVLACSGLCACGPVDEVGRGGRCYSLGECKAGLACIEGRCSDDLSSIVGEVPMFETAAQGGGGDAAAADSAAPITTDGGP